MKYTAKEVLPEWTDSCFDYEDYDLVSYFGNPRMHRHTTDLFDQCREFLEQYSGEAENIRAHRYREYDYVCGRSVRVRKSAREIITRDLPIAKPSRRQVRKILDRLAGYCNDRNLVAYDADDYVAELMTIANADGVKYSTRTLRGCCQGDWQTVIGPADTDFDDLEARYFNTGTAYTIEDECGNPLFRVYCTEWRDEDQLKHVAEDIGCDPADVQMMKFDGWAKSPKYRVA